MPADQAEAAHVVHALLLGFKESPLADSIDYLSRIMREYLNWQVCTYWIGVDDIGWARDRLENVLLTLKSHVRHPSEKIVVYYGGHAVSNHEDAQYWSSDCGFTLHGERKTPEVMGSHCPECLPNLDPSIIVHHLTALSNDVLFLFHSFADINQLSNIAHKSISLQASQRNAARARNVQVLVLQEDSSMIKPRGKNVHRPCHPETKHVVQLRERLQPDATYMLGETLQNLAYDDEFSAEDLYQDLLKQNKDVQLIETCALAGERRTFIFRGADLDVARAHGQDAVNDEAYSHVGVLLLKWDGVDAYDDYLVGTMSEAFQALGYEVQSVNIPEVAEWGGHDARIGDCVRRFLDDLPEDGLCIIYYIGHGAITSGCQRLRGFRIQALVPSFDLTLLQTTLRDQARQDVLLLLDCCHAGFIPPLCFQPYSSRQRNPHTTETLAACPSTGIAANSGSHTFTMRLAAELLFLAGSRQNLSVDKLNTILLHDWRYREREFENANMIAGNVRVLNCGDRSIRLGRLAKGPPASVTDTYGDERDSPGSRATTPLQEDGGDEWSTGASNERLEGLPFIGGSRLPMELDTRGEASPGVESAAHSFDNCVSPLNLMD